MIPVFKKSRYHKITTKSKSEIASPEEEELKKYRDIVEKLGHNITNKKNKEYPGSHYTDSAMESNLNSPSSNLRPTTSRTKEIINDRDFLINFMNDEAMPILPKNMHLLTDDDSNQNIDDKTKFKNLADLLLDDRESIIESYYVKNVEEKLLLKLYTALSRRSNDIFMEEKIDKKDKNRILLHKINNIEIPTFRFEDKDTISNKDDFNINLRSDRETFGENENVEGENNIILSNLLKKSKRSVTTPKSSLQDKSSSSSNPNLNKNQTESNDKYSKEKPQFLPDCKYNKKNNKLKIIKLPTLDNFTQLRGPRVHKKSRKIVSPHPQKKQQWEPDIDGDFLGYINHNIIKIEDIYNKGKENIFELKENLEEEVKPIEATEIVFDMNEAQGVDDEENTENINDKNKSSDRQMKKNSSNLSMEDDIDLKNKNKFCEYKDRTPNLIGISLLVEPEQKKLNDFQKELKALYSNRINEIGELDEEMFPSFGKDLKSKNIYRFALNNERNEEINTDSFTLLGASTNISNKSDKPVNSKQIELNLNLDLDDSKKNEEGENNIKSEEGSMSNKENNKKSKSNSDLQEDQKEKEKIDLENDNNINENDTGNLYSLEDNYENNEQSINTNNNVEKNEFNEINENNVNNMNYENLNEMINEDFNNIEDVNKNDNQDHFLNLSISKNSSN